MRESAHTRESTNRICNPLGLWCNFFKIEQFSPPYGKFATHLNKYSLYMGFLMANIVWKCDVKNFIKLSCLSDGASYCY